MSEKRKLFAVSAKKAGGREEVLAGPGAGALGRLASVVKGAEMDLSAFSPGLSLRRSGLGERYTLNIPQGLSGVITVGKDSLPIEGLVGLGLLGKKGKGYALRLPQGVDTRLSLGQCDLTFGYRELEAEARAPVAVIAAIDKSIRRPLITKEDYNFVFLAIAFFVLQFSTAAYLRTIEIHKKDSVEALKQMAPRFAKLILQPPKEKPAKVEMKAKEEEKPEEAAKEEKKEEAAPEEEAPKQAAEQTPQQAARRDAIRAKVRSKGLLSVIGAKSIGMDFGPIDIPGGRSMKFAGAGISTGTGTVSDEMFSRFKSEEADALEAASSRAASLGRQKDSAIMAEETLKETKGRETLKDNVDKKGRKVASAKVRAEEEVYRTIRSYMGGLKYIYNNALRTNQSLKGKISVKITIAPSGRVTTAEMVSSTLDSQELREALVERINKWKFTELKNVEDFTITYTFDFAPVS